MEVQPLEVQALSKTYFPKNREPFCAVQEVSFTISAGECFGLLGPNGAGKSTTMNCIVGFYPPTTGLIKILGIDVAQDPRSARRWLGICSQEDTLDTDFTVLDQMVQYASYFGISKADGVKQAVSLLSKFGLSEKCNEPVEELSGGMRRRLQVARALISEPKVLILDEPTTGLDPEARRVLWREIDTFRSKGGAVLLSTHYMEEAERLCDRVGMIHQGLILDCASPTELIAKHSQAQLVNEEVRPGVFWERPANLEDVYLKVTGTSLHKEEKL